MGDGDNQYKRFKGFKVLIGDESNPTFGILVDDASKALHICEPADQGTDWNVAADTHPTLYLHSATTPATDYIKLYHDATIAYLDVVGGTTLRLLIAGTAEIDLTASAFSPAVTDSNALGTTALMWSDLFLASAGVINFNNGNLTLTHAAGQITNSGILVNTGKIAVDDTTESTSTTTGSIQTDGGLGVAKDIYAGDDIFLTSGAVLNFDAGDVTITHSANSLAIAGGTSYTVDANLTPASNDGAALGTGALKFSDVYLASGSTMDFNNGDVLLTHSSNLLTLSGGGLTVTVDQFISGAPIKTTKTAKSAEATLTTAEAGTIEVTADNITMYLPTYVGNAGLTYTICGLASYTSGVKINGNGAETVGGATTKTSGARYDSMTVQAGTDGYNVIGQVGTWS